MKKKLIEVALPLETINDAAAYEKMPGIGPHPRGLHLWWARRPLAAARAIIFSQMVDDPSSYPDLFPNDKAQEKERKRLFKILEELVKWENVDDKSILEKANMEIWESWRRTCAENADHPRAKDIFNRNKLPRFHDPFAGGGAIPLEAQRLGIETHSSDLNPVAVLINKAMIDIPQRFFNRRSVNPDAATNKILSNINSQGFNGIVDDIKFYSRVLLEKTKKQVGHLYPQIEITTDLIKERPDLKSYKGKRLNIIAWLWARTVNSPNPAFANKEVPLVSTFILSSKEGKEVFIEPKIKNGSYSFAVKTGKIINREFIENGTKVGGSSGGFLCLLSGTPITFEYIRGEAKAGRMGARLMALVVEGDKRRFYISPNDEHEQIAKSANPSDIEDTELPLKALGFRIQEYGMTKWKDLYTKRQLLSLSTLVSKIEEVQNTIYEDGLPPRDWTLVLE